MARIFYILSDLALHHLISIILTYGRSHSGNKLSLRLISAEIRQKTFFTDYPDISIAQFTF